MICFILSCKRIEDCVAKTAFLEKENLAILIEPRLSGLGGTRVNSPDNRKYEY